MDSQTLESMLVCSKGQQQQQDKKPRPAEQALKCPRCDSNNTKFCYYNNYSLSQPRYFCKSCRRYWTKGGTLRNVPVGGGCRRNKRSSSSSLSKRSGQDQQPFITPISSPIPSLTAYDSNDLNLAFARLQKQNAGQLGLDHDHHDFSVMGNNMHHYEVIGGGGGGGGGLFEALRGGFLENPFGGGAHNLYYGNSMGMHGSQEMGMGFEDFSPTATAVKQEMCNAREVGHEGRVLWGFPWAHDHHGNVSEALAADSGTNISWNGMGSTNWHAGLLM